MGNTCINFCICLVWLPSPQDVQHYLAYTVKVMELTTKFSWPSVLQYDDDFHHVQAAYNNYLILVILLAFLWR